MQAQGNQEGADELAVGRPAHLAGLAGRGAQVIHEEGTRAFEQHVGGRGVLELQAFREEPFVEVEREFGCAMQHGRGPLMGVAGEEDAGMFPGPLGQGTGALQVRREGGRIQGLGGDPEAFLLEGRQEGCQGCLGRWRSWPIHPGGAMDGFRPDPGAA